MLLQVSIDILTVLVRWSPVPVSDVLVSQVFPAVVQCTLHTDDSSTMQVFGFKLYANGCMLSEYLLRKIGKSFEL